MLPCNSEQQTPPAACPHEGQTEQNTISFLIMEKLRYEGECASVVFAKRRAEGGAEDGMGGEGAGKGREAVVRMAENGCGWVRMEGGMRGMRW